MDIEENERRPQDLIRDIKREFMSFIMKFGEGKYIKLSVELI